jgi:hypothetical protein
MKYKIVEISPLVYCAIVPDQFDLAMLFWRAQEYYESASPKFRGRAFTLLEYMKWYSAQYGKGSFTYAEDWAGFNLPSSILTEMYDPTHVQFKGVVIDHNEYDFEMASIYKGLFAKSNGKPFYLLGAKSGDIATIRHELAHGLYFTNSKYKMEMQKNIKALPRKLYDKLRQVLRQYGYAASVHDDEIQAFLSTGLTKEMRKLNISKEITSKFKKSFLSYG